MKKGDLVRVVTGSFFGGYAGKVVSMAREWNITYAYVDFAGLPNPAKINADRLEPMTRETTEYEQRLTNSFVRKPQAFRSASVKGH